MKQTYFKCRRCIKCFALLFVSLLLVQQVHAQDLKISGSVTNDQGKTISGVSISLKGTKNGTVTDGNGYFTISTPVGGVLVFSFVGYEKREMTVSNKQDLNVTLSSASNGLDEVVVVAYGTQKKASVTGSIAQVSGKEITTATNPNVANLLAGKLPGLRVAQTTGEPGDYATNFDIRGFGAPLVIIDGVPRNQIDLSRLNPNDIESVSVLKDASAAVYGVRSGNGVILVTTKKGSGKAVFNYSATYGVAQMANSPQILNSYQYATLTDESYVNAGATPPYSAQQLQQYQSGALPSTNWLNLVLRKSAPEQQQNISASGSSDKTRYYLSFGEYNDGGIYKSGDIGDKKYNFRSNITTDLTKDLQVGMLISGLKDDKYQPGEGVEAIYQALWSEPPTLTPYANNNPAYLQMMPDGTNPVSITNSSYSGYADVDYKNFNGTVNLNYKVPTVPGLQAKILYSYTNTNYTTKNWIKEVDLYDYDPTTQIYSITGSRNAPTTLSQSYTELVSSTAQASLEYEKSFHSGHNIKALLLTEEDKSSGMAFNGSRQFALDAVDQLYAGNTTNQTITSTEVDPAVNQGIVGRVNYDYNNKYLLEGSFREDGSSKFAVGHRWGFFPAVSGGWRISDEPFLKDKVSFLNDLKIRASYGVLGDDASSSYQYLSGYNYPGANYVLNGELVNGLGFRGLTNENLSWYTNHLLNLGFDAEMFSGKLSVSADVFSRKRDGLLATRLLSLPGTVGAALPQENLNSDLTRGFEASISYKDHVGDFRYNIGGNIAFTRTKNLYVEEAGATNSSSNWLNNPANRYNDIYWGYKVIGQFKSEAEIKSSPVEDGNGNRSVLPGDLKYQDLNHDGVIDAGDLQPIGKNANTPEVTFGFTINVQWKGFDLSALFQGATDVTVSYLNTIALDGPLAWGRNGLSMFTDRWHHENLFDPNSPWVPGKYPSTRTKSGTTNPDSWNYLPSNFWLQNASYLRLKSLELGYTLPSSVIGKTGFIRSLRIYVNGFDLITWSSLNKFIDPEHTSAIYGMQYPIMKNYNLGVNLTF